MKSTFFVARGLQSVFLAALVALCLLGTAPTLCLAQFDCNGDGVPDAEDITDGTSADCQPNGVPDECEGGCAGGCASDADCDDGIFCDGAETCDPLLGCQAGSDPYPGQFCDETADVCTPAASSLSVGELVLSPGDTGEVLVSGTISGDSTFGVTVLLEIVPQSGSVETVTFTQPPPVDIVQRGHPWPLTGTFSAFDTDSLGSNTLNGSLHDNGIFIPSPVNYGGPLSGFPVIGSSDAGGVWDLLLATSAGEAVSGYWLCSGSAGRTPS